LPAAILILDPRLSNATPAEERTFNILASIAQFERQIMLERQCEGIAKAKAEGKYTGRAPTARANADEVKRLLGEGVSATDTARRLGIGRPSVYRIIAQ
jgi:DNA invertase Pin-like site-specific DNA recombinase